MNHNDMIRVSTKTFKWVPDGYVLFCNTKYIDSINSLIELGAVEMAQFGLIKLIEEGRAQLLKVDE